MSATIVENLLQPVDLEVFRTEYWDKRALHVSGSPTRLQEHYGLRLDELLTRIRLVRPPEQLDSKAQFIDGNARHQELRIDPAQAQTFFDLGMTVCIGPLDGYFPHLPARGRELKAALQWVGATSFACYWSPDGSGFGLHFDNRPVFVLQLAGEKTWTFGREPAVAMPPKNLVAKDSASERAFSDATNHAPIPRPDPSTFDQKVLRPGDVLYLPAGTWHQTAARGSSLALTLRFFPVTLATLLSEAVELRVKRYEQGRRGLPFLLEGAREVLAPTNQAMLSHYLEIWKQEVAELDVSELSRLWLRALARNGPPDPGGGDSQIEHGDRFVVLGPIKIWRGPNDTVFVVGREAEIAFPSATLPFLETLISTESFRAGDSAQWIDLEWIEVRELLSMLRRHTVIRSAK